MQSHPSRLIEYGREALLTGLPHRVQLPQTAGPHPTVVMLQGRMGNEEVMWVFSRAVPDHWLQVAPRAIMREQEDERSGYSWLLQGAGPPPWPQLDDFDAGITAVVDFIEALPEAYNADPEQIYLMGFSQGAALSYGIAMRYPGLVQAIAGLVGFAPQPPAIVRQQQVLTNLPVFMAVGTQDKRVPLPVAHACRQTLTQLGVDLTYAEYDTGHKLDSEGMRQLEAWWALQAEKI